jgi:hypothetical protein
LRFFITFNRRFHHEQVMVYPQKNSTVEPKKPANIIPILIINICLNLPNKNNSISDLALNFLFKIPVNLPNLRLWFRCLMALSDVHGT